MTTRQVLRAGLELPLVSPEQFSDFPANAAVQEQVALLMAARTRREAVMYSDHGQHGPQPHAEGGTGKPGGPGARLPPGPSQPRP